MTRLLEAEVAVPAQCELAEGPDGLLDTVVRLPVSQVTSAAFGGADLSTLYITTARENFTADDLRKQPHVGDIFACTSGVTSRPPYLFGA